MIHTHCAKWLSGFPRTPRRDKEHFTVAWPGDSQNSGTFQLYLLACILVSLTGCGLQASTIIDLAPISWLTQWMTTTGT